MKTRILNIGLFLILIIILSGCKSPSSQEIYIIKTHGVDAVFNVSKTGGMFGSGSFRGKSSGVAVGEGDILTVVAQEGPVQFTFQYSSEMNKELNFNYDSLNPFVLYLENAAFAVRLKDSASWNFIKNKKNESLAGINSIELSLPLKKNEYAILSDLSKAAPTAGLIIDLGPDVTDLDSLLSMFNTESLILSINSSCSFSDSLQYKLDKLQTLMVNRIPENLNNKNGLAMLKNLREMSTGFDNETTCAIDFSMYKNIKSLILSYSGDTNTFVRDIPENLESLFFINCGFLNDVKNLSGNRKLRFLGFNNCDRLTDISPVYGMKNLQWLSCPPSIDQAQFDTLIPSLTNLTVLELIGCDSLKNVDCITKLKGLRALTVQCAQIENSGIPDMKNLELLVFDKDANEKEILTLSERFPRTQVVSGRGLCLGSGWILLLLPLIVIGLILSKKS